jgi:hypothetical protein
MNEVESGGRPGERERERESEREREVERERERERERSIIDTRKKVLKPALHSAV